MMNEDEKEELVSKRVRRVSKVMAIVFVAWFVLQYIGGQYGWLPAIALFLDFIALFTFIWALFELWKIFKIIRKD